MIKYNFEATSFNECSSITALISINIAVMNVINNFQSPCTYLVHFHSKFVLYYSNTAESQKLKASI